MGWTVSFTPYWGLSYPVTCILLFRLLVGNLKGEYVTERFEEGLPPHPYKDALFAYVTVAVHLLSFTLHSCL